MALTDINFQEGEGQDFVVELPTGTLNSPTDILTESEGGQFMLLETPEITSGGGSIFIMSE